MPPCHPSGLQVLAVARSQDRIIWSARLGVDGLRYPDWECATYLYVTGASCTAVRRFLIN
eukprot:1161734-Pelagomonas_calceolata.AAC.4